MSMTEHPVFGPAEQLWQEQESYYVPKSDTSWDVQRKNITDYFRTISDTIYKPSDYQSTLKRLKVQFESSKQPIYVLDILSSWDNAVMEVSDDLSPVPVKGLLVGTSDRRTEKSRDNFQFCAGNLNDAQTWIDIHNKIGGYNKVDLLISRGAGGVSMLTDSFAKARSMLYMCYRMLKNDGEMIAQIPGHFHFYQQFRFLKDELYGKYEEWAKEMNNLGLAEVKFDMGRGIHGWIYMRKLRDVPNPYPCLKVFGAWKDK